MYEAIARQDPMAAYRFYDDLFAHQDRLDAEGEPYLAWRRARRARTRRARPGTPDAPKCARSSTPISMKAGASASPARRAS